MVILLVKLPVLLSKVAPPSVGEEGRSLVGEVVDPDSRDSLAGTCACSFGISRSLSGGVSIWDADSPPDWLSYT